MAGPRTPRQLILISVIFLIAAGVVVLRYARMHNGTPPLPVYATLPPFTLTTERESTFGKPDLLGRVTIADFIFTSCAGPCPMMSGHMQELQKTFSNDADVRLVSFSVDPETDGPQVLQEYGGRFHAQAGRWTFLTGDKQRIYGLIRDGFLLPVADDSNAIAHSTKFVLIDRSAAIRGYYDSLDDTALVALENATRALLAE
jgi:protein SCO1/2